MKKFCRKVGAVVLSAALAGTLFPSGAMWVSAAAPKAAKKLTVTASTKTLYVGGPAKKRTTKIKVSIKPSGASKDVTFQSSNKRVAKVSAKGKVSAVKAGKAVITVKAKSNKKLKKKIIFTVKNHALAFASKTVTVNLTGTSDTTEQKLTLYGAKGKAAYTSSNEDVAAVDQNGKVTAKRMGRAVITAAAGGKTVTCTVKVQKLTQAIHDPSVYRDPISGRYYSFGSHLMAATSSNLIGWSDAAASGVNYSVVSTLFTKEYTEEFAEPYAFTNSDR